MRPAPLFPLFAPLLGLPGVGPKTAKPIAKAVGGERVLDVLFHLPFALVDRRARPTVAAAPVNEVATIEVQVIAHRPGRPGGRSPYRVVVADETGEMQLVYFKAEGDWLSRLLPLGATRLISGRVETWEGIRQMPHPDYVLAPEEADKIPPVEPIYPLSAGVNARAMAKVVLAALELAPAALPEWLDPALQKREGWPEWRTAWTLVHRPGRAEDVSSDSPARRRLAYDELLANQLALSLVRRQLRRTRGRPVTGTGAMQEKLHAALPYRLTNGQDQAIAEIAGDLASPTRMLRLLQGDVGAGKTVVALFAMAIAVEAGRQACLMAPTELLARQHGKSLAPLCEAAGIRLAVLTGRDTGAARKKLLAGLAAGEIDVVVGTHALLEGEVAYRNLGLAVIDEQHRFGVDQRLALAAKGEDGLDVLVMSATPIPRTLTLTAFGDMDVSRLTEKPAGRQRIDTRIVSLSRLGEMVEGIARAIASGAQVYWVCPLVTESETTDAAAAEDRFAHLSARFGAAVGLVHGRLKAAEKDRVMQDFAEGRLKLLVATTVIEVGVDVPQATVMVIEQAERFGLAQLHQLRGRVGRGAAASFCILLTADGAGRTARRRLETLRDTDDGFVIAEADLQIRGAGEILGTKQSGIPEFRLVDLDRHADLMEIAHDDARLILERDPRLEGSRGEALRYLLYLFERDAAVRYLASG
ncbi:ATP-dependent DNA helicase RecG [Zavarzinia compransoris]|uniref:Probable DNA 3'-5' helicase RecG n=1 Tax=Zavarzinia compransoris TaxID=1264899 RepID=A0A317ECE2_9PROT|nr:ATP-dependent DNA helicase RecG [Zavarzinia compransoris]PWR23936.1 ATP-dependent DNA helicase RecG [Zavarzinia compransoris]TDP48183.1 ATP-dependent DNA helicase RecG [Zavarzinia compransoris]